MLTFLAKDREIAEIAARQHGVVSLAQLRAAGASAEAVRQRVRAGRLHRVHRGVYAVGHARIGERGRLWAAVLAVPGSALSHRTAAALWDLCPTPSGRVDLTTTGGARSTSKLRVHRTQRLTEVTHRDGLPTTTVARTLRDLATNGDRRLKSLMARAEHQRLLDTISLAEQFGRPGGRRLERELDELRATGPNLTRSELEERFLEAVGEAGLPRPEVNARIEGHEVDFLWRNARLIVETDGAATHLTATAFEADRRRDAHLASAGWRVLRFTWRQVTDGSAVRTLRKVL